MELERFIKEYGEFARRQGYLENKGHRTVLLKLIDYITMLAAVTRKSEHTLSDSILDSIGSLLECYKKVAVADEDFCDRSSIIYPRGVDCSLLYLDILGDLFILLAMYIGTSPWKDRLLRDLEKKFHEDTSTSVNHKSRFYIELPDDYS